MDGSSTLVVLNLTHSPTWSGGWDLRLAGEPVWRHAVDSARELFANAKVAAALPSVELAVPLVAQLNGLDGLCFFDSPVESTEIARRASGDELDFPVAGDSIIVIDPRYPLLTHILHLEADVSSSIVSKTILVRDVLEPSGDQVILGSWSRKDEGDPKDLDWLDRRGFLKLEDDGDILPLDAYLRVYRGKELANLLPDPLGAIVFDFDGVFTDNKVTVLQDARELVTCSRGDGMGITLLRRAGVKMLVLSAEENPVTAARASKLKIECLHGISNKLPVLREWAANAGLEMSSLVYLGNDVNDKECLEAVGCGVVVGDAHPSVIPSAKHKLLGHGGNGAVRELADAVLATLPDAAKPAAPAKAGT